MTIARLAQPVKQLAQRDQISHPERATASSHRHERILITKVRPRPRNRPLPAVLINEEHRKRRRWLSVLKSRGMAHSNSVREYMLTDHGLQVLDGEPVGQTRTGGGGR